MKRTRSPALQRVGLRQLDERLVPWLALTSLPQPRAGWIHAVRQALGMGITQLARRLRMKPSSVVEFEKREVGGTITVKSLRRVAEALDCTLVYALVPNSTLGETVKKQALKKVREKLGRVGHSMVLEAQSVDADEAGQQEADLVQQLLIEWPRTLWDDDRQRDG
ncbi:MAG: mobile mystery protein A [Mycobacterium sp.]